MKNIGLALSGGGYRAAAFHLGTLRKLNELKILSRINVISTVSGGSIIGAYYCLTDNEFKDFEDQFATLLKKSVVRKVLTSFRFLLISILILLYLFLTAYILFCTAFPYLSFILLALFVYILIRYQFAIFPVSKIIEKIYNDFFYSNRLLTEFKEDKPEIVINSSNLQTGRQFYFTKYKMTDSTYEQPYEGEPKVIFNNEKFPVAKAVMCSSCVPFAFTPVKIGNEYFVNPTEETGIDPVLIDGGIYDNQGIHKLTHPKGQYECDIVIVSDAGNKLPFQGAFNNIIALLMRTSELFMNRIKNFQMMNNLYQNTRGAKREITYISLAWGLQECLNGFLANLRQGNIIDSVVKNHGIDVNESDDDILAKLKTKVKFDLIVQQQLTSVQLVKIHSVGTNLTALSHDEIYCLSKHAELQTELQVRLYCPSLLS